MNDWRARAACVGMPANFWFPEKNQNANQGRRVCAGCPVRQDCYDAAVANGERFGVWGGVNFVEPKERPRINPESRRESYDEWIVA